MTLDTDNTLLDVSMAQRGWVKVQPGLYSTGKASSREGCLLVHVEQKDAGLTIRWRAFATLDAPGWTEEHAAFLDKYVSVSGTPEGIVLEERGAFSLPLVGTLATTLDAMTVMLLAASKPARTTFTMARGMLSDEETS